MNEQQHSHTALYVSLGLLLVIVLLLLMVIAGTHKNTSSVVYRPSQVASPLQEQASAGQTHQQELQQSVTPVPIETKQDLTTQQNVLDNTDMTVISSGLDQNSAAASQFSQ